MVAVGEHASAAPPQAVEGARDPDREPLNTTRQGEPILGFDQQVQVIVLHRVVHQPEDAVRQAPGALLPAEEGVAQDSIGRLAPQPRQSTPQFHRYMDRKARREGRTLTVGNARVLALLPPRARPRATPTATLEGQLFDSVAASHGEEDRECSGLADENDESSAELESGNNSDRGEASRRPPSLQPAGFLPLSSSASWTQCSPAPAFGIPNSIAATIRCGATRVRAWSDSTRSGTNRPPPGGAQRSGGERPGGRRPHSSPGFRSAPQRNEEPPHAAAAPPLPAPPRAARRSVRTTRAASPPPETPLPPRSARRAPSGLSREQPTPRTGSRSLPTRP